MRTLKWDADLAFLSAANVTEGRWSLKNFKFVEVAATCGTVRRNANATIGKGTRNVVIIELFIFRPRFVSRVFALMSQVFASISTDSEFCGHKKNSFYQTSNLGFCTSSGLGKYSAACRSKQLLPCSNAEMAYRGWNCGNAKMCFAVNLFSRGFDLMSQVFARVSQGFRKGFTRVSGQGFFARFRKVSKVFASFRKFSQYFAIFRKVSQGFARFRKVCYQKS